jgi:hypothetical protein
VFLKNEANTFPRFFALQNQYSFNGFNLLQFQFIPFGECAKVSESAGKRCAAGLGAGLDGHRKYKPCYDQC